MKKGVLIINSQYLKKLKIKIITSDSPKIIHVTSQNLCTCYSYNILGFLVLYYLGFPVHFHGHYSTAPHYLGSFVTQNPVPYHFQHHFPHSANVTVFIVWIVRASMQHPMSISYLTLGVMMLPPVKFKITIPKILKWKFTNITEEIKSANVKFKTGMGIDKCSY